jgi:hypothetical protein
MMPQTKSTGSHFVGSVRRDGGFEERGVAGLIVVTLGVLGALCSVIGLRTEKATHGKAD